MRKHPLYKKLKTYALANLSQGDLEDLTIGDLAARLDIETPQVTQAFFDNMKRCVFLDLQSRDDEIDLKTLKEGAKSFLDINFPNWEAERGRESGRPFLKIWLRGKP
jgi:hypothetical protein